MADAAAVHLVNHILADNNARAGTFGLDSALATRGFAAVKSGTSKDLRDNWCIGFTDRYTVGVWVGNTSGDACGQGYQRRRAGVACAGAGAACRPAVAGAPLPPPGVETLAIRFDGAQEPPRSERFLAGTGQALQRGSSETRPLDGTAQAYRTAQAYGITSPRDGSVFALDPDIPPAAQRITFEGEAGSWWLDGRRIGRGTQVSWASWPGPHRLELRGGDGQPLQVVRFEVRGASVKRVALAPGPATR